jgi:hypothetical protein
VTATFAAQLCGYRKNGAPSTSDASQAGSVEWGRALFRELGIPDDQPEVADIGRRVEDLVIADLLGMRDDLTIDRSQFIRAFDQYQHLGVFDRFRSSYVGPTMALDEVLEQFALVPKHAALTKAARLIEKVKTGAAADDQRVQDLIDTMPEESLLKLDVTVSEPGEVGRLLIGLSAKWSLRTDRAQDCLAQGSKLVSMRRGPMPHYATLTMEPRPSMLRLLAYGSGAVDCVYHLALPELRAAAAALDASKRTKSASQQCASIERMVAQGRLRDYDDLKAEVRRLR